MATSWVSNISGPIASHDVYNDGYEDPVASSSRPYSRPVIKGYQYGSDPMAGMHNRGIGVSKDYAKENVRKMRELARVAKEREAARHSQRGPVKASQRFADVPARVYNDIPDRYRSDTPYDSERRFLRSHEKTGPSLDDPNMQDDIPPFSKRAPPEKLTVPRANSSRDVHLIRRDIDFVKANAHSARRPRTRSASPAPRQQKLKHADAPASYRLGEVPEYLRRRQQEWAEDDAAYEASRPDPEQPAGHKKMPNEERLHTLSLLEDSYAKLLSELNRLPIRTDTFRVRQRKENIETKLSELDQAIRVFSRPKVFVKN